MKTFYAIRNKETKVLLSIELFQESEVSLKDDKYSSVPWITDSKQRAEDLISEPTYLYDFDSGLTVPKNSWMFRDGKFQNYEVVEVTLEIANENLR